MSDLYSQVENTVADYLVELIADRPEPMVEEFREERIRLATLQVFSTLRSRIIFARDETAAGIADATLVRELSRGFLLFIGVASS